MKPVIAKTKNATLRMASAGGPTGSKIDRFCAVLARIAIIVASRYRVRWTERAEPG
jgi:hypothetical protein